MPTQAITDIHAAVIARFPDVVFGGPGVPVCRKIKNTSPAQWSQHAYGNGQDYGGPPEMLEQLYQFLLSRRGVLPVGTLCHNGRGGCTTAHKTHVHVDGLPRMVGTPKCAGGTPRPKAGSKAPSGGPSVAERIRDITLITNPITGPATVFAKITGATNPLAATTAALAALFNPITWIRVGLATGGAALLLMELSALLGDSVTKIAALAPGPVGAVAKIGATVGGKA